MSRIYQLFKVPINEDDVVERAKRTGEVPEVRLSTNTVASLDTLCGALRGKIRIKIGHASVPISNYEISYRRDLRFDGPEYAERGFRTKARGIARELSGEGIEVTCLGQAYSPPEQPEESW